MRVVRRDDLLARRGTCYDMVVRQMASAGENVDVLPAPTA